MLIQDFITDDLWNTLILLAINQQNCGEMEEETILGIRTNVSSVIEYCNLLISLIFKSHKEQVEDRMSRMMGEQKNRRIFGDAESEEGEELVLEKKIYEELETEILESYKEMNIMDHFFEMQRVYH